MLGWFYKLPLIFVFLCMLFAIAGWSVLYSATPRKVIPIRIFRTLSVSFTFLSFILIIYATIIGRPTDIHIIKLIPFQSFKDAQAQPETYRTLLMNVALFVPLGLSLTTLLSYFFQPRKCIIFSLSIATILSLIIEIVQYSFGMGLYQTDDVICNVLGVFLGSTSLPISNFLKTE